MENTVDLNSLWKSALSRLAADSIPAEQRAFINLTVPLEIWGDTILLAAPNEFTKDVFETRLRPTVNEALSQELGREVTIAVKVDEKATKIDDEVTDDIADLARASEQETPAEAPLTSWRGSQQIPSNVVPLNPPTDITHRPGTGARPARPDEGMSLNPKYTFDTFVAGSSNRFAHAAAVAVAEQPAKAYNPLFIYGESGLGKTHLLHAIGFYTRQLYQGAKVRYVSSEDFTNDFINSIRDDRGSDFQRRFREIDVLLIDDVQFMSGKQQTQEQFFHTFNSLHNANKQIVLTSDLHPRRLDGFEDRLRSRFEWGLTTDVQPPELETRMAILRKKAQQERLSIDPDVLEFVASKISSNIRELEGALIRVTAYASLNQARVDVTLAQEVLHHLITDDAGPEITEQLIMVETAKYFGITLEDLQGASRSRTLVTARQIAMYLCRDMTDLSLPRVGQAFGGRDHTTVMHAERKIKGLMSEKRSLYNQVSELTSRIRAQAKSNAR